MCQVVCNYTIAVGKSDIAWDVRREQEEDSQSRTLHTDTTTTNTVHPPDAITQAVTSAILLLSNDEYHCRYDKSRLFVPGHQQTKFPATRLVLIISCLRQAARRQGLESISA